MFYIIMVLAIFDTEEHSSVTSCIVFRIHCGEASVPTEIVSEVDQL